MPSFTDRYERTKQKHEDTILSVTAYSSWCLFYLEAFRNVSLVKKMNTKYESFYQKYRKKAKTSD